MHAAGPGNPVLDSGLPGSGSSSQGPAQTTLGTCSSGALGAAASKVSYVSFGSSIVAQEKVSACGGVCEDVHRSSVGNSGTLEKVLLTI